MPTQNDGRFVISSAYQTLCASYYHCDKPHGPPEAVQYYGQLAKEAAGPILEPMCGTGNFLLPLHTQGYDITGFDSSEPMLAICRAKGETTKQTPTLFCGSFESIALPRAYALAFIPLGSFGLLTTDSDIRQALSFLHRHLQARATFAFTFETVASVHKEPGLWHGSWVTRPDGAVLVLNTNARFDPETSLETTLCKYELWVSNRVVRTEVEVFSRRLFTPEEIATFLQEGGFTHGRFGVPYTMEARDEHSPEILVECTKV